MDWISHGLNIMFCQCTSDKFNLVMRQGSICLTLDNPLDACFDCFEKKEKNGHP